MGTWFKRDESMDIARKWLSVGAGAASFIVAAHILDLGGIVTSEGLLALMPMLLMLGMVVGAVVSGVDFICCFGPRAMNGYPPPLLVALGLIFGALIVIAGAIYISLKLIVWTIGLALKIVD